LFCCLQDTGPGIGYFNKPKPSVEISNTWAGVLQAAKQAGATTSGNLAPACFAACVTPAQVFDSSTEGVGFCRYLTAKDSRISGVS